MRVPRRILVPTDLSSFSLEAMEYADQIAKLFNGEIIIFHALPHRCMIIPAPNRKTNLRPGKRSSIF